MVQIPNNPKFVKHVKGRTVAEAFVKGGFPVLVSAHVNNPEPDVGIFGYWVDSCDIEVWTLRGYPAHFIESKLSASDRVDLEVALLEQFTKELF